MSTSPDAVDAILAQCGGHGGIPGERRWLVIAICMDGSCAELAGKLRNDFARIAVADDYIAACCLQFGFELPQAIENERDAAIVAR